MKAGKFDRIELAVYILNHTLAFRSISFAFSTKRSFDAGEAIFCTWFLLFIPNSWLIYSLSKTAHAWGTSDVRAKQSCSQLYSHCSWDIQIALIAHWFSTEINIFSAQYAVHIFSFHAYTGWELLTLINNRMGVGCNAGEIWFRFRLKVLTLYTRSRVCQIGTANIYNIYDISMWTNFV